MPGSLKKYLRLVSYLVLGAISLGSFGCALTKDKIDIGYVPTPNALQVAGAGAVSVSASDQRLDKSRVGVKKNGYGMEMAAIESKRDVSDYVRDAVEAELKNRGFRIAEGRHLVRITVLRFANDFKTGLFAGNAVAELEMEVAVPGTGFSRRIDTQGKETNIQLASGGNAQLALEAALSKGLRELFTDDAFLRALR